MSNPTRWFVEADYLQACNCDYGCPCEFEAPPTMGFCEGIGAYQIKNGKFGDVALDGLAMVFAIKFPGPMHKGNGTVLWLFDERATPAQRQAMISIASGEAGGMPFEILKMLFTTILEPQFLPIQIGLNGRNSTVQVGQALTVNFAPIKNPVSGEPEDIRLEHGTGFIFKAADCVAATKNELRTPGLSFSYPDKAGFVTAVRYANG